ncbi:MAG: STAS domain-containing protein [Burkholderiales bacterium]
MDLSEEKVGGVTVVEVKGRIDSTTAPALGERLTASLAAPKVRVVLDLSRLEYISSAGFRILLLAAKRADVAGSRFVLCGVSGKVRQLFDLGGFIDLFTIAGSRDEGIAAAQ